MSEQTDACTQTMRGMSCFRPSMATANYDDVKPAIRMFHVKHSLLSDAKPRENFIENVFASNLTHKSLQRVRR
ncbi:MAG: hypothetical protein AAFU68_14955 [Pseudomonadota bacterium]